MCIRRCAELSEQFAYPVITASQAIEEALKSRQVKRLAIASPQLGRRVGPWVLVEGGLEPGAQVIVSPVDLALEGIELEVTGEEPGAE